MATDPIEVVYGILSSDPATTAIVGTKISPVMTPVCVDGTNAAYPNITLSVINTTPMNSLTEFMNLDLNEVQVNSWAMSYAEAVSAAYAARRALEAQQHFCISRIPDEFASEPGTDPGVYRVAFVHHVWIP